MPKNLNIKKIVVLGSGPIIIGQAAEFDYSGSQACISLREEGYEVVLINSNPATIMTDDQIADQIYLEPLTVASVSKILRQEKPDALLPTLGGQTGLNLAVALNKTGILDELHIQLLGTSLKTIEQAEDREEFKTLMDNINQPIPASLTVHKTSDALIFANQIGYPVIVRPAFTLGGTGGGIAHNDTELQTITDRGLSMSPSTECLIEKSIAGYKEIEFEIMRDAIGTKINICCMENFDPVGIHTGDSIVVAPNQTLTDVQFQTLRSASLSIVDALEIKGGCNVQLALNPQNNQYYVIEVNPRVSRSSALASKATGYPIAKITAKIAVGLNLNEIINPVTKNTFASFEPALDYVVVKIPRFPFDKFTEASNVLGTQMKATGEVMGIGLTFEEALLKAVACLEIEPHTLKTLLPEQHLSDSELASALSHPTDQRLFQIFDVLNRDWDIEKIINLTKITPFFLHKLKHIWEIKMNLTELDSDQLKEAKKFGFSNDMVATASQEQLDVIEQKLSENQIKPVYKMVDTCAGEFNSETPYFYSSYFEGENESYPLNQSVIVLGSGPIRIGQGVEFDYTTVHCVQAIQQNGLKAIIINNNPETVSTDFSISDKLYFEPLTIESVMNIVNLEKPLGVVVQFGGQTAINLTEALVKRGVNILGTSLAGINQTENRQAFEELLLKQGIKQPNGATAMNLAEAKKIAPEIGYPVMVRPSFVLGGRAMAIVQNEVELTKYVQKAIAAAPHQPILIDHYVSGIECEADILSDGKDVFIPGIMEHLEGTGIHSGDSIAVYPAQRLTEEQKNKIIKIATKIGQQVHCVGMMNIQLIVADDVYVIEVNPRASRTVPFISKVTGIHLAQVATSLILGKSLTDLGLVAGYLPEKGDHVAVKAPVFSFMKLPEIPSSLSPEMKSTGETIGFGSNFKQALSNALTDSYHLDLQLNKKVAILDDVAKADSELVNLLSLQGLTITEFNADQNFNFDHIGLVINAAPQQTSSDALNYFALSHSLPLFTATDTIKGILKAV